MAIEFIVENGNGLVNATTYASIAEADQYLENTGRNLGAWAAGGDAAKQRALNLAADYMQARWNRRWKGRQTNEFQRLDWPRIGTQRKNGYYINSSEVPLEVKEAQTEYALLEITSPGTLFPTLAFDDTNRLPTRTRDKVDVLETEREYGSGMVRNWRSFPIADGKIKHLVSPTGQLLRV